MSGHDGLTQLENGARMEAATFAVQLMSGRSGEQGVIETAAEAILLMPDAGVALAGHVVDEAAVAILPAGRWPVDFHAESRVYILTSTLAQTDRYRRIAPLDTPYILPIRAWPAPADHPRLRMLQSDALSINWVDYVGPRDRTQLSPHAHRDFEQGSLALCGAFIHHLRTPWGGDATLWQEDRHLSAGSDSLLIIPPHITHTSEGVGEGRNLLIDLFSPPRADFIGQGFVFNAGDYRAP